MKKTLAIVFILIFVMSALCACQKEVDMVEDMVSTVMTPDNYNNTTNKNNNGTVTDNDGYIGNETKETTDRTTTTTDGTRMLIDDSVL